MLSRFLLVSALAPFLITCGKKQNLIDARLPDEVGEEGVDRDLVTPEVRARGMKIRSLRWAPPSYSPDEEAQIMEIYQYMDPQKEIPQNLLRKALLYFHRNRALIPRQDHVMIVDFSQHSRKSRMYMLSLLTGAVGTMHTSHGKGSDTDDDGYADTYSNIKDSNQSSLGFFITGETYFGAHGYSLRIDGLSDTNSNVRDRAIVIHGADYVVEQDIKQGRSLGCFVLSWTNRTLVIDQIREGTLIYAGLSRETEMRP